MNPIALQKQCEAFLRQGEQTLRAAAPIPERLAAIESRLSAIERKLTELVDHLYQNELPHEPKAPGALPARGGKDR